MSVGESFVALFANALIVQSFYGKNAKTLQHAMFWRIPNQKRLFYSRKKVSMPTPGGKLLIMQIYSYLSPNFLTDRELVHDDIRGTCRLLISSKMYPNVHYILFLIYRECQVPATRCHGDTARCIIKNPIFLPIYHLSILIASPL